MLYKSFLLFIILFFGLKEVKCQNIQKVFFDLNDTTDGYYLAIQPKSNEIKGVIVLLTSFTKPEDILSETKLHNVAYVNDILTIVAGMKQKLYADSFSVHRINDILINIINTFHTDTSKFAIAGYDESGNIALRYTELAYEFSSDFPIQPKAVFGIDSQVDLFGLWYWSEEQIKKNYWPGAVGDAKFYLDAMTKENGTIYDNPNRYNYLTPFNKSKEKGNEKYLINVATRLYYDTDIQWQLNNRRNSYFDTKMPNGSELIKRLLISGNARAEFIPALRPGLRSNGIRHPNSFSIVDEVDCILWIKRSLDIFDPKTWIPPYNLEIPEGWNTERFHFPLDFAPQIHNKGYQDVRFTPGWGDPKSEDYWSYMYMWWLEGNQKIDANELQDDLYKYYTGLVGRNITRRNIKADKIVPIKVIIKNLPREQNDIKTYSGTIQMVDYMTQLPIVLNTQIHLRSCKTLNHTIVFIGISPKSPIHAIWKKFNQMENNFECKNLNDH